MEAAREEAQAPQGKFRGQAEGAVSKPTPRDGAPTFNPSTDGRRRIVPPADAQPSRGVVPPYWRHSRATSRASQASRDSAHRSLIMMEDHSDDPACDMNRGLWAKSVAIDDHVVVKGTSGIGAYVVWNCKIYTLEGSSMIVRMRYSEFVELRDRLILAFPHAKKSLPALPPKSAIFKFSSNFLEKRRVGLAYFLNCVLLNPEFSGSPVVKETLFSHCS